MKGEAAKCFDSMLMAGREKTPGDRGYFCGFAEVLATVSRDIGASTADIQINSSWKVEISLVEVRLGLTLFLQCALSTSTPTPLAIFPS